jgi:hypothetical protein
MGTTFNLMESFPSETGPRHSIFGISDVDKWNNNCEPSGVQNSRQSAA